jgi:hypothetical protein
MTHLRYHFGFPGTREWWHVFAATRGLSPVMMEAMKQATTGPLNEAARG